MRGRREGEESQGGREERKSIKEMEQDGKVKTR